MTLDPEGGFDQLMALGRGFQAAKMLSVAVELAIFDFLEEPRSAVEDRGPAPGRRPRRGHLLERPGGPGPAG